MTISTRIKPATFENIDEFEGAIDEVCDLDLQLRDIRQESEVAIAGVRAEGEELAIPIRAERDALAAKCQVYAEANRIRLLGTKKSTWTPRGKWGFRLQSIWKWPKDLLDRIKAAGLDLIRVTESPDKAALKKEDGETLHALGIEVEPRDIFFIEPKKEKPE